MSKQTIPTSMAPEITIEKVAGSLQVRGWENPEVEVRASSDDLSLETQEDAIQLSCGSDCDLRLPHGATLRIEKIDGNAQFRFLEEELSAEQVGGNLSLRDVAGIQIEKVGGDFSAKALAGDIHISQVQGNVHVRDVQGKCWIEKVDGNLDLRDVEGDIQAKTEGNARLRLGVMLGSKYQIRAAGNVHCQVPEDASVKLSLSSGARIIRVMCPDQTRTYQQSQYEFTLDDGDISLELSAGGLLYLICQGGWERAGAEEAGDFVKMADLSEQIARQVEGQIESQMEAMSRQIADQMANLSERIGKSGFSPEETERIMEKARQASEREAARAQAKMHRAQEKLERKLEAARRHREAHASDRRTRASGRQSWTFDWVPPTPPVPPPPEPVSEEERLMILRMLEQKKITLEEADRLLSALEGNEE